MLKLKGLSVTVKQGDFSKSLFLPGAIEDDFEEIRGALEVTGELTVMGYGLVWHDDSVTIPAGTTKKMSFGTVNLKDTSGIVVATMQGKFVDDSAVLTAMASVAKGKILGTANINAFEKKATSVAY